MGGLSLLNVDHSSALAFANHYAYSSSWCDWYFGFLWFDPWRGVSLGKIFSEARVRKQEKKSSSGGTNSHESKLFDNRAVPVLLARIMLLVYLSGGEQVTVFDNLSRNGAASNLKWLEETFGKGSFEMIVGDVRDAPCLQKAAKNVDVLVHLAAQVAVTTLGD